MRYILLLPLVLLFFTACEDKEALQKQQALLIKKATEEVRTVLQKELLEKEIFFKKALEEKEKELQEIKTQLTITQQKLQTIEKKLQDKETLLKKYEKLSKTGVLIDGDTLVIDANKTQAYFKSISKQIESKLSKFAADLKKGIVKEKEAGIEIDESRINIDFNKTKSLIETWGKKIQEIAKDFDALPNKTTTTNNQ